MEGTFLEISLPSPAARTCPSLRTALWRSVSGSDAESMRSDWLGDLPLPALQSPDAVPGRRRPGVTS